MKGSIEAIASFAASLSLSLCLSFLSQLLFGANGSPIFGRVGRVRRADKAPIVAVFGALEKYATAR